MNKKSIRYLSQLRDQALISENDVTALQEVVENFSLSVTQTVLESINKQNLEQDPIAKQFLPTRAELHIDRDELKDPVGDLLHAPIKGIVHRYPDRCLLLPLHICPVYCRFCFRREQIADSSATLTRAELDAAFHYIEQTPAIMEVIITGGDPLMLKPKSLSHIMEKLAAISHVDVVRIHTRVPFVDPVRVNRELLAALKGSFAKAVYVVVHANHPNEFTQEAIYALSQLVDHGIPLLSQSVLLKGINDHIETLGALMRAFVKHRVKPYYLHQADLSKGTSHFRTTLAEGQTLMRELRGRYSGLCQPEYVLDIPGGFGKVPIGPVYWHYDAKNQCYHIEDYLGERHDYAPKTAV